MRSAAFCMVHLSLSASWQAAFEGSAAGRPALAPRSKAAGDPAALIQYGCALERSRPARRPAGQRIQSVTDAGPPFNWSDVSPESIQGAELAAAAGMLHAQAP